MVVVPAFNIDISPVEPIVATVCSVLWYETLNPCVFVSVGKTLLFAFNVTVADAELQANCCSFKSVPYNEPKLYRIKWLAKRGRF